MSTKPEPLPHSFLTAPPLTKDERERRVASIPSDPIVKAVNTAIMQLIRMPIPRVRGIFDAQDFIGRAELLTAFANIVDPVVATITSEAAEHDPGTHVDRKGTTRMLTEALEDRCVLSAFEAAAERCREDAHEMAVDLRQWARASDLGVD